MEWLDKNITNKEKLRIRDYKKMENNFHECHKDLVVETYNVYNYTIKGLRTTIIKH